MTYAGLSWGKPIFQPLTKHLRIDQITKTDTEAFFKALSKTGKIQVKINSINKVIAIRKGYLREDIENPSTRTGKENFYEISASFPLSLAKKAEVAQLLVQDILLAQTPIKEIGRVENNRMIVSWRLRIK
jgi:hypothetical protein